MPFLSSQSSQYSEHLRDQAHPVTPHGRLLWWGANVAVILIGTLLLAAVQRTLNEDQEVLFFFFGVPAAIGLSFVVLERVRTRRFGGSSLGLRLRTGGLLAAIIALPMQWVVMYIMSKTSVSLTGRDTVEALAVPIIILVAWTGTLLVSRIVCTHLVVPPNHTP
jgi:hypothetical protein